MMASEIPAAPVRVCPRGREVVRARQPGLLADGDEVAAFRFWMKKNEMPWPSDFDTMQLAVINWRMLTHQSQ